MSDLSFDRLPPTVLSPSASEAVAAVTASDDQPSPASQWFGDVIGGAATAWTVHLYADAAGHNITCGANITGVAAGQQVIVGFFADGSVAITGIVT